MIRDANVDDLFSIAEIEKKYFSFPHSIEQLKIKDDKHELIVFDDDNKIKGYISMTYIIDEGYIDNIAVIKEFRHKGIGDELLINLLNRSWNLNLKFVSLEVRKSNQAAISLYKKHGFVQEGLIKNYYSKPIEDALILTVRKTN